ncbi:putative mitochondrial protein [Cucumis melo var. makuwa]|uniref:Mitochondrial protein n=1 Tax=Cucumis melo var. makuwa TaxID=1194695 RepID=A0A5A7SIH1_CUCMM|nr:putative mitochondrial protein [Cucumis melo var. makuwa]TYK04749.1 putative mitochondrial protein [Cucumis melo var. makuwa]
MFPFECSDALPISIDMVLTKLNSPLELKLACLLGILCTNEAINASNHLYISTLLPWMSPFIEDCFFFLVSLLQGVSVSEESNYMLPLESTFPTVVTLPHPSPYSTILLGNQVPWKTYCRRNFIKGVKSLVVQTTLVQNSEPIKDQDREDRIDENEVVVEHTENETKLNNYENTRKYDPSLDLPIALKKEMKALEKNNTREIYALPKEHKHVGCKWVFILKYKADGTLDIHKVDLDVKNAFLNGDLVEEVYISPSLDFEAQLSQ